VTEQVTVSPVEEWYAKHDYDAVMDNLRAVREVTLHGNRYEAGQNIRKAYYFAVLSIRTQKHIHEKAFDLWDGGMNLENAMLEAGVNFYKNKCKWIASTESRTDWETVAQRVRDNLDSRDLVSLMNMCQDLSGVHYVKWGFTLAMSGIWEIICIDSNVKNHFEISGRLNLRSDGGIDVYFDMVEQVTSQLKASVPPFIAQWVIYDVQRGEHARHRSYFRSAFPFISENGEETETETETDMELRIEA